MDTQDKEGERRYGATLVSGHSYGLKDKQFFNGVEREVSEKEMLHLSENAVFTILTPGYDEQYDHPDDRTTTREMFEIRQLGADERIESDVDQSDHGRGGLPFEERRARALSKIKPAGTRRTHEGRERYPQGN